MHSIHRGVGNAVKNFLQALDIKKACSKITNGSALPKVLDCAGDSQSGLKYSKEQTPIVRRLTSTG
jgi:hypothetical protein